MDLKLLLRISHSGLVIRISWLAIKAKLMVFSIDWRRLLIIERITLSRILSLREKEARSLERSSIKDEITKENLYSSNCSPYPENLRSPRGRKDHKFWGKNSLCRFISGWGFSNCEKDHFWWSIHRCIGSGLQFDNWPGGSGRHLWFWESILGRNRDFCCLYCEPSRVLPVLVS